MIRAAVSCSPELGAPVGKALGSLTHSPIQSHPLPHPHPQESCREEDPGLYNQMVNQLSRE